MNKIAEEIMDMLKHDGTERHSGRYPWGSGKNPFQRSGDFLARVESLEKQGKTEKEICEELGMTSTSKRLQEKVAKHERWMLKADRARALREDGKSLNEIAEIMGYENDSSVRALLNAVTANNKNKALNTAAKLKEELELKGGMLDVGKQVSLELGVSDGVLKEALFVLETEGYNVYKMGIPSVNNFGKQLNTSVLANKDIPYGDVYKKIGEIESVGEYHSDDGGNSFNKKAYPSSLDSKRVMVRYGDEGGTERDGTIELRRGVKDLSLGKSSYAQVRILVDDTHYLKGMALYNDDMPDGVDVIFNTNKKSTTPKMDAMKKVKEEDPKNPFGAYIKANGQVKYMDDDGVEKVGVVNKIKEEGDWVTMDKNLSSQFLSKQPIELIKKQLKLTYANHEQALDEINSLTNPTLKKKLLLDFAGECDGAAMHLQAAALPRQQTQVLLPLPGIKDHEVYAPNFIDGEKVALIRYPHGGTFEIPILTVNNKNKAGSKSLGKNLLDAIGINSAVAEQLSGADFDGDQVVVIPISNANFKIKADKTLDGLKNFNAKDEYAHIPGMKTMTKENTQKEMGIISNLITDMTLKGAPPSEITKAVKHSMVVIDAEKHKLNYKQSEKDNDIKLLKKRYQGYVDESGKDKGGASTLISRRKQTIEVNERKGSGVIDYDKDTGIGTGKVVYKETGREYVKPVYNKAANTVTNVKITVDPETKVKTYTTLEKDLSIKDSKAKVVKVEVGSTDAKVLRATTKISKVEYYDDVNALSSGKPQETAYADYANKMKALANTTRKTYKSTGNLVYSKEAKLKYSTEVSDLQARLNVALGNAPKERKAQAIANGRIKAIVESNPDLKKDKKQLKKISQQVLNDARDDVGAKGKLTNIKFSEREWEAIQAGAITDSKLTQLLKYADPDNVRELALPKTTTSLSPATVNKIKTMQASGYTNAEIAADLGKSISTITEFLS